MTSTPPRLFLSAPHMSGNELRYVEEAFASNYVAPIGPMIAKFETDFSAYTGFSHAVALTSGTAAIHLALRLLGVTTGDVVIASSLTFIGSIAPILYQHATPIFIDAHPKSWCMDVDLLEETLTDLQRKNIRPKAVLPTDLYGQSCDIDAMKKVCDRFDVPLVIDAAESVGAHYQGKHAGRGAKAAAFSFNGNKIITSSGGGMLASDDEKLISQARFLATQARDPAPHYEHSTYGYNYRMSNIVAAIGRAQLEVIEDRVAARRQVFQHYCQQLGGIEGISFASEMEYGRHTHWLSVMLLDPAIIKKTPEELRHFLEKHNIESRPVWKPMHLQPALNHYPAIGGKVSEEIFARGLCLPSGSAMSKADITRVCALIREYLGV